MAKTPEEMTNEELLRDLWGVAGLDRCALSQHRKLILKRMAPATPAPIAAQTEKPELPPHHIGEGRDREDVHPAWRVWRKGQPRSYLLRPGETENDLTRAYDAIVAHKKAEQPPSEWIQATPYIRIRWDEPAKVFVSEFRVLSQGETKESAVAAAKNAVDLLAEHYKAASFPGPAEQIDAARCPECGAGIYFWAGQIGKLVYISCKEQASSHRWIANETNLAIFFRAASLKQETQPLSELEKSVQRWVNAKRRQATCEDLKGDLQMQVRAAERDVEEALAASSPLETPAADPAWQPIATAPKDTTLVRVKMKDGSIHQMAHWAEDLSGSAQPPFSGWFIETRYAFSHIGEPEFWMPIPTANPEEEQSPSAPDVQKRISSYFAMVIPDGTIIRDSKKFAIGVGEVATSTEKASSWGEFLAASYSPPAPADTGAADYQVKSQVTARAEGGQHKTVTAEEVAAPKNLASTGDTPQPLTVSEAVDEIDSLLSAAELDNEPLTVSTETGLILTELGRQKVSAIVESATSDELERLKRTVAFQEKQYLEMHGGSWGECKYKSQLASIPAATGKTPDALTTLAREICEALAKTKSNNNWMEIVSKLLAPSNGEER
jgi:predicted RNase H-like HicB family nuclease